ncbi:MAG: phenylalanine--tRNA ligase subunit beta, partial [Proteobacteria bacterium]
IVEEFARLHGYQHIPETIPALSSAPAVHETAFTGESRIRRLLQGAGLLQAINYAFVSKSFQETLLGDVKRLTASGLRAQAEAVALMNPLNEEIGVMRTSLMPGLVKNVVYNSRHGNQFGRLFELGFGHFSESGADGKKSYPQEGRLGFAFWGNEENLWNKSAPAPLIFALKGSIETLLRELGFKKWKWITFKGDGPEFLHPGQSAALQVEGKNIGFIGTLHPSITTDQKIRESVAVGELALDKLVGVKERGVSYSPLIRMSAVDRDLAFVMPRDLAVGEVEGEMRKAAGELLRDVRVFDVFEGKGLEEGKRSVAFRLVFQSKEATLEDAQINELRDKVVKSVGDKFGISLR